MGSDAVAIADSHKMKASKMVMMPEGISHLTTPIWGGAIQSWTPHGKLVVI